MVDLRRWSAALPPGSRRLECQPQSLVRALLQLDSVLDLDEQRRIIRVGQHLAAIR
jgi:hypothetical protein